MPIVDMSDMSVLELGVSGTGGDTWRQKLNVGCAVVLPARMLVVGDVWVVRVDADRVLLAIVVPEDVVDMMLLSVIRVAEVDSGIMLAVDDAIGIINLMLGATAACPGSVSDGDIDAHSSTLVLL